MLKYYVRNQLFLGKELKTAVITEKYGNQSSNFIAESLGFPAITLSNGRQLSASEHLGIVKAAYKNDTNTIEKYLDIDLNKDIFSQLKSANLSLLHPGSLTYKRFDLVKAYSTWIKNSELRIINIKNKKLTLFEHLSAISPSPKSVLEFIKNDTLIKSIVSIVPKYKGKTTNVTIYGDDLYCPYNEEEIDYEDIVRCAIGFLVYPCILRYEIMSVFAEYYLEHGTVDFSKTDKMTRLGALCTFALDDKPLCNLFNSYRLVDLEDTLEFGIVMFPSGEHEFRVVDLEGFLDYEMVILPHGHKFFSYLTKENGVDKFELGTESTIREYYKMRELGGVM